MEVAGQSKDLMKGWSSHPSLKLSQGRRRLFLTEVSLYEPGDPSSEPLTAAC